MLTFSSFRNSVDSSGTRLVGSRKIALISRTPSMLHLLEYMTHHTLSVLHSASPSFGLFGSSPHWDETFCLHTFLAVVLMHWFYVLVICVISPSLSTMAPISSDVGRGLHVTPVSLRYTTWFSTFWTSLGDHGEDTARQVSAPL